MRLGHRCHRRLAEGCEHQELTQALRVVLASRGTSQVPLAEAHRAKATTSSRVNPSGPGQSRKS